MNQNPRKNRSREIESGVIRFVDHQTDIAKQIIFILKKMGKNQSFLAEKMKKNESEISKWLSGTHNFTLKTISKIEDVFGESIIICPKDAKDVDRHYWVSSEFQTILLKEKPNATSVQEYKAFPISKTNEFEADSLISIQ